MFTLYISVIALSGSVLNKTLNNILRDITTVVQKDCQYSFWTGAAFKKAYDGSIQIFCDESRQSLKGLVRQEKVYKKEGMKEEKAPFLIE